MFRVLVVTPRSSGCCQTTRTWSRKLYCKLQGRPFHHSTALTCSRDDESYQRASFKTSNSKVSRKPANRRPVRDDRDTRHMFKRLNQSMSELTKLTKDDPRRQDRAEDDWKSHLDEGDTFGTLSESPEFEGRSRLSESKGYQKQRYGDEKRVRQPDHRHPAFGESSFWDGDNYGSDSADFQDIFDTTNSERNFNRYEQKKPDYGVTEKQTFMNKERNFKHHDRQRSQNRDNERRSVRSDDSSFERYDRHQSRYEEDDTQSFVNEGRDFQRYDKTGRDRYDNNKKNFENYSNNDRSFEGYDGNNRNTARFDNDGRYFERYNNRDRNFKKHNSDRSFERYDRQQSDYEGNDRQSSRNSDRKFMRNQNNDRNFERNHNNDRNFERNHNNDRNFERNHNKYDRNFKKYSKDDRNIERFDNDDGNFKNHTRHQSYVDVDRKSKDPGYGPEHDNRNEDEGNTFGLLSQEGDEATADLYGDEKAGAELLQEEMNFKPHIPLGNYLRRHEANWYARRIIKLGRQGKVREAITVFDEWMIKQDRVKPTAYEFTVLLTILGQVGYTRKAFKLYHQMIRRGIKDTYSPHVFTCLFNACANSPWPEDGLRRARYLRTRMLVRGVQPNRIIYNAMIKTFGMCGDINTAFTIADEVVHFHKPDSNLLASLLVACISDKESGFRHAILVWRKMKKMGVEPELKDYCLLLRAVNECGIGSQEVARDILLDQGEPQPKLDTHSRGEGDTSGSELSDSCERSDGGDGKKEKRKNQKLFKVFDDIDVTLRKYMDGRASEDGAKHEESSIETKMEVEVARKLENAENLEWWQMDVFLRNSENSESEGEEKTALAVNPEDASGKVLDPDTDFSKQGIPLNSVRHRDKRLAIIGGYRRLLGAMKERDIEPDIVFFTQLMLAVSPDEEDSLLDEMDMADVKPDITFYNLLLKKRAVRNDEPGVRRLMKMVEEHDLVPNIQTYGCLALTCDAPWKGTKLLKDIQSAGMEPNITIMTSLFSAVKHKYAYKISLLRAIERFGIPVERKTLDVIEGQISRGKKLLAMQEQNPKPGVNPASLAEPLEDFIQFYDAWCRRNQLARPEHPWAAYRPHQKTDTTQAQAT